MVLRGGHRQADWDAHLALKTHRLHKKAKEQEAVLNSLGGGQHRVAIAITVTKDPDFTKKSSDPNANPGGFVDGAAILAHSVAMTQSAEYPVDMVALVNPKVHKMRPLLPRPRFKGF